MPMFPASLPASLQEMIRHSDVLIAALEQQTAGLIAYIDTLRGTIAAQRQQRDAAAACLAALQPLAPTPAARPMRES